MTAAASPSAVDVPIGTIQVGKARPFHWQWRVRTDRHWEHTGWHTEQINFRLTRRAAFRAARKWRDQPFKWESVSG